MAEWVLRRQWRIFFSLWGGCMAAGAVGWVTFAWAWLTVGTLLWATVGVLSARSRKRSRLGA